MLLIAVIILFTFWIQTVQGDLTCGDDHYCCEDDCCENKKIYEHWWFWFIWIALVGCVSGCITLCCTCCRHKPKDKNGINNKPAVYSSTLVDVQPLLYNPEGSINL